MALERKVSYLVEEISKSDCLESAGEVYSYDEEDSKGEMEGGWKRGYVAFVEDVVKLEDVDVEGGCRMVMMMAWVGESSGRLK